MIGNDVVDLATAKKESNWRRKGFLAKLFTAFEQELIRNAINQEEVVWILWSIKESTYKAYQRIHFNRGFYPSKIEVQNIKHIKNKYESEIQLFGIHFYGKSHIKNGIVSSIVVRNKLDFKCLIITNYLIYSKDSMDLPFCSVSKKPVSVSHHGKIKEILHYS